MVEGCASRPGVRDPRPPRPYRSSDGRRGRHPVGTDRPGRPTTAEDHLPVGGSRAGARGHPAGDALHGPGDRGTRRPHDDPRRAHRSRAHLPADPGRLRGRRPPGHPRPARREAGRRGAQRTASGSLAVRRRRRAGRPRQPHPRRGRRTTPSWSRRCGATTCGSRAWWSSRSTAPTTWPRSCGPSGPGPAGGSASCSTTSSTARRSSASRPTARPPRRARHRPPVRRRVAGGQAGGRRHRGAGPTSRWASPGRRACCAALGIAGHPGRFWKHAPRSGDQLDRPRARARRRGRAAHRLRDRTRLGLISEPG